MKFLMMISAIVSMTVVASAGQNEYVQCANQHNEIVALAREAGEMKQSFQVAAEKTGVNAAFLDELEHQMRQKDAELSLREDKFDKECLKQLLK